MTQNLFSLERVTGLKNTKRIIRKKKKKGYINPTFFTLHNLTFIR